MKPFPKTIEFPPVNKFIIIYSQNGEDKRAFIGVWTGKSFVECTPPNSTNWFSSCDANNVIGWDFIKNI